MSVEEKLMELEANLRSVTDRVGKLMDQVLQKGFLPFFRCGHSGLLLPGDYLREWGRLYGIGLGPSPSSEVLDSEYDIDPPDITPATQSIEQIMHPVRVSMAQVDLILVAPEEAEGKRAILAHEDKQMRRRCAVVLQNQLKNPKGRIRLMRTKWEAT